MQLTEILCCPITRQSLTWADESTLQELNQRVEDASIVLNDGTKLESGFESALTTLDGAIVYPVVKGVFMLLESSAIHLNDFVLEHSRRTAENKRSVREFYEHVGWMKTDHGDYADTVLFEDRRPVSANYNSKTRLKVNNHIDRDGTYLLDIACGAVPFDEYVSYSESYQYRICADFSLQALAEAQSRLGDRAMYIQCDITQIPLRDNSVDGFVSLHTIYHVPAEEQLKAFAELVRVLRPGCRGVVVYSWPFPSPMMALFHPVGMAKRIVKALLPTIVVESLRARWANQDSSHPDEPDSALYFHPFGYSWYCRNLRESYGAEVTSYSSITMSFQQRFAHDRMGGRRLLSFISLLERRLPHLTGRIGQYPMFLFKKQTTIAER